MPTKVVFGSKSFTPPKFGQQAVIGIILLVFILILGFSSFYTIAPEEVGVVQRFGKFREITPPGLHGKLPLGVDHVTPIKVLRQQKAEFGFRTREAATRSSFIDYHEVPELLNESLMVSGDLNIAIVEWIIQYRIVDPESYLFKVRDPDKTLLDASQAAMREVVGDHAIDEILTTGRQEIADTALKKLQTLMDSYKMGIRIEQVLLQDVTPPDAVKSSFDDVNKAQQERESMINQARADYNKAVPRAKGEAKQKIQEAQGYAMERVNRANGDATKFDAVLAAYLQAPEVTRRRIYLETMAEVIPKVGRKLVIDKDSKQVLPLLSLTPAEEAPKQ